MLFGTIHKLQFCSFFRFDILYFTLHPGALIISLQNWSFRKDKVYRVLLYMLLCWTLNPSWTLYVNPGSLFRFFSSLLFIELAIVVSIKKIMMYLSIIQRHKQIIVGRFLQVIVNMWSILKEKFNSSVGITKMLLCFLY